MKKIDIIIGLFMAFMVSEAHAQPGAPPQEIESQISSIHKATDSGKGIPCSSVRRTRSLETLSMAWLNYIGSSHPFPSHPISM